MICRGLNHLVRRQITTAASPYHGLRHSLARLKLFWYRYCDGGRHSHSRLRAANEDYSLLEERNTRIGQWTGHVRVRIPLRFHGYGRHVEPNTEPTAEQQSRS
eukprot:scpid96423/ scgid24704/ 